MEKPIEEIKKIPVKKEPENRNVINEIKSKPETKETKMEVEKVELLENEIQTPYIPYSIIPRIEQSYKELMNNKRAYQIKPQIFK